MSLTVVAVRRKVLGTAAVLARSMMIGDSVQVSELAWAPREEYLASVRATRFNHLSSALL